MVFSRALYCYYGLLRGTLGIASDMVASANNTAMEDRTYNSDPYAQLRPVPGNCEVF